MTSFSDAKQPELETCHSSLPTIQNYASNVASSSPRAFMTLFLIPGVIVSNTVVLTRAVAERSMRPACGLVDTKPGTDVTRTTVVAACLHQQVGARGRVPTASIRPHCVVLHYEQRGSWDTPDELNQLCLYMYQKISCFNIHHGTGYPDWRNSLFYHSGLSPTDYRPVSVWFPFHEH
jgi:hypothetical protein